MFLGVNLTNLEASYIAGLIDGEGTITFCVQGPEEYHYSVKLSISNTSFKLLQWVKESTGVGNIYETSYIKPRHKQGHNWILNGKKAQDFIGKIIDYLILKKPQAKLARSINLSSYQFSGVPVKERNKRLMYLSMMRKLNKRGR